MNNKNILGAVIAVVLLQLAWLDAASAFSFCFSLGGGTSHRARDHYRSMPAIGFDPGYWQAYPDSQVTTGPYAIPVFFRTEVKLFVSIIHYRDYSLLLLTQAILTVYVIFCQRLRSSSVSISSSICRLAVTSLSSAALHTVCS